MDIQSVNVASTPNSNSNLRIAIEKTIITLGPYVKYPRLEFKYLQKPPFLFVHDITTYVIRNHGFLHELFTADELNRNIIKTSKQRRADFLKKLVAGLRTVSGDSFPDCNWNKLAAGCLPILTNKILHSIANALSMKMNCRLAVKKLNGTLEYDNGHSLKRKFSTSEVYRTEKMEQGNDNQSGASELALKMLEESHKRRRDLTIWDVDVEEVEFVENFNELNKTLEKEYEEEHRLWRLAEKPLTFPSVDTDRDHDQGVLCPDLEMEFESMDLS